MISFLDFPYDVRRRVYIMAGLVRVCPVNMNTESLDNTAFVQAGLQWATRMEWPASTDTERFIMASKVRCRYQTQLRGRGDRLILSDNGIDCMCPKLPTALLRICRTLHDEVFKILYAENRFRVCQTQARGLRPLLDLSPRAAAHLRTLSIRLNRCCCTRYEPCELEEVGWGVERGCRKCHAGGGCRGGSDTPLQLRTNLSSTKAEGVSQQHDMRALHLYRETVSHLSKHIQPGRLRLSVICDCADEATARHVATSLTRLPRLAACDIRLGQRPNTAQADIAQKTALDLVGRPSDPSFPFAKLPIELQMRVLSHTQLVPPEGIINWWPLTIPTMGKCCFACTGTLDACCCYVQHGAFSTSDGRCSCWVTPVSLFLVNHRFYECGTEIFFSHNIFEITWLTDGEYQDDGGSQSLPILLNKFPESAYRYIRNVHIVIYGLWYEDIGPDRIVPNEYDFDCDWKQGFSLMSKKLTLPRLTLWVEDRTGREESVRVRDYESDMEDNLEAMEEQDWTLYQLLVQPIVDLGVPLRDFALEFDQREYGEHPLLRIKRRKELEQRVMGEAYCSDNVPGLRHLFGERKKTRPKMFDPLSSMPEGG